MQGSLVLVQKSPSFSEESNKHLLQVIHIKKEAMTGFNLHCNRPIFRWHTSQTGDLLQQVSVTSCFSDEYFTSTASSQTLAAIKLLLYQYRGEFLLPKPLSISYTPITMMLINKQLSFLATFMTDLLNQRSLLFTSPQSPSCWKKREDSDQWMADQPHCWFLWADTARTWVTPIPPRTFIWRSHPCTGESSQAIHLMWTQVTSPQIVLGSIQVRSTTPYPNQRGNTTLMLCWVPPPTQRWGETYRHPRWPLMC